MITNPNPEITTFSLPHQKTSLWWNSLTIYNGKHHLRWALLIISFEFLLFIWLPVFFSDSGKSTPLLSITLVHIFIVATIFFMFSLNWHQETNDTENSEREFRDAISKISSSLLQDNLKVASNHINVVKPEKVKSIIIVSADKYDEAHLRRLDREMMIKESIASINNVIQARQSEVSSQVSDVQKQMQKFSRSVTAAVSGGAGGFIAYELGSSVKNFWLLTTHQHPIDMNYWLTGTVQHFADPTKIAGAYNKIATLGIKSESDFMVEEKITPATVHKIVFCPNDSQSLDPSHRCALATQPGWAVRSEELDAYMNSQFRQPELLSEAILLTVTLFVSFGAAYIGWRKSTISSDN